MAKIELKAGLRVLKGKATRKLRRDKLIPGAISRYKADTVLIQVPLEEVYKLKKARTTDLIVVSIDDAKETYTTLLTELLVDPITEEVISFTLTEITPDSKIKVEVPVTIVGEAPIIKKGLGVLVVSKPTLKLVLNLNTLIEDVKVDISSLTEVGDTIDVKDILANLPEGIKLASYNEINDAVVTIVALQKTLEEETASEESESEEQTTEGEASESSTTETEGAQTTKEE